MSTAALDDRLAKQPSSGSEKPPFPDELDRMSVASGVNVANPTISHQNTSLARWLSSLSIALLLVFLAGVLTAAVPARLLDPAWQL